MRQATLVVTCLATLFACGCRGNGGGGGASPTAPPMPPPTPPRALAVVQGTVAGLFDASNGFPQHSQDFSASVVSVDSVVGIGPVRRESDVSATNSFRIEDVPVGEARVSVFGPNHVYRRMTWEIREGTNTFDEIDLVNDVDFSRRAYHAMFHVNFALSRWVAPARVIVISPNISPSEVITAILELTNMTRAGFSASVEVRPPSAAEREALEMGCEAMGAAALGKIFVGQGMNDEAFACRVGGEPGMHPGPELEIAWARVRVRNTPQSIRHGLGHAAGAKHPCGEYDRDPNSLMSGDCDFFAFEPAHDWTVFDRQAFLLAYSRPVGTLAQDDTRFVEIMTGTVTQTGSAADPARAPDLGATEPWGEEPTRRIEVTRPVRVGEAEHEPPRRP